MDRPTREDLERVQRFLAHAEIAAREFRDTVIDGRKSAVVGSIRRILAAAERRMELRTCDTCGLIYDRANGGRCKCEPAEREEQPIPIVAEEEASDRDCISWNEGPFTHAATGDGTAKPSEDEKSRPPTSASTDGDDHAKLREAAAAAKAVYESETACANGAWEWMSHVDAVRALLAENDTLKAAIKTHHDQKADDRCWMDDATLYEAAGLPMHDARVGDKRAMLENCKRFIDRRCGSGGPWKSYAELEAERDTLRRERDEARQAIPGKCPISGLPFFMVIEQDGKMLPTYGGPYTSYTVPERDKDNNLSRQIFDHDEGHWNEWESFGYFATDDDFATFAEAENKELEAERDALKAECERLRHDRPLELEPLRNAYDRVFAENEQLAARIRDLEAQLAREEEQRALAEQCNVNQVTVINEERERAEKAEAALAATKTERDALHDVAVEWENRFKRAEAALAEAKADASRWYLAFEDKEQTRLKLCADLHEARHRVEALEAAFAPLPWLPAPTHPGWWWNRDKGRLIASMVYETTLKLAQDIGGEWQEVRPPDSPTLEGKNNAD